MSLTAATSELAHLNPFVGIWDTEGKLLLSPAEQAVKFKATDTYEWLPGGYFLLHRFEAKMPAGPIVRVEIIGYNRDTSAYTMYSFDSEGHAGELLGRYEMDNWTFVGETTLFTGGFGDNGRVFSGLWERRPGEGADWQPWMEVSLNKVV